MPRAVCAGAAAGGRGQDLLLDFARLAGRSGLDLFPRRRQAVGQGHRQDGQHLVPQRRRALAAGGGARRDRRQGRRASSPRAPIRAAWSRSSRRRTPPDIPIINFNTPDPTANFNAYVGGDLVVFGKDWAQYLVDKNLVKSGDFVWMPVEIPGATYGVQEEEGIKSVFKPLGITWEVTDATLDQAEVITRMTDYLTANRKQGQGDHRPRRPRHRLDQARLRPGRRQAGRDPGRRLGQLARHHAGSD